MYPRILIDAGKYRDNVQEMKKLCARQGITLMGVTKVFCATQRLVEVLNDEGVDFIADSRVENLRKMKTTLPKVLLRLASRHEVDEVVLHADYSLNSDIDTIRKLDAAASEKGKKHGVILMVDIGDLREGIYYRRDIVSVAKEIDTMQGVHLAGLGTNLTCYGGVIPDAPTLQRLVDVVADVEEALGRSLDIVSGGNSSHIPLLQEGIHIDKVNNLRVGEALALGRETAYGKLVPGFHDDVFILETDILEIGEKPSVPEGTIGMDAFGKKPSFQDKGMRKRAILAVGKQDVEHTELKPFDEAIELIGSSSDHIIADLTVAKTAYKTGDVLRFKLTYGSLLSLMTSPYVVKRYV